MRALLAAVGTRGDVQPALALALELRTLGHAVRLCISPNFIGWARSLGLEAVPMGVEMRVPRRQSGTIPQLTPEELRRLRESMPDLITDQFATIGAAAEGCDVIVGANAHQYAGPSIAERAGIGCVTAVYAPVALPTPDLAPPPAPGQPTDAARTSIDAQWRNTAKTWNERALDRINQNRRRLGMGPIDDVLDYVLTDHTWLAADPVLAPAPATPGRRVFQTGTWVFIPHVVTPMFADQFYWADRIVALGIGTSTPHATLTEESLAGALRGALDPSVALRAGGLAAQVRRDGAVNAARRLEADYDAKG